MRFDHLSPETILDRIGLTIPVQDVLDKVAAQVPFIKRQIAPYQGAVLYALALRYNHPDARILEIGTAYGYSAALLAEACPQAKIVTLNPNHSEAELARQNLASYPNVEVAEALSWEYLKGYRGSQLDMVFVDGDHKRVRNDLPWWDWLKVGGLLLFHDYSPAGTYRECPPVYEAVNDFAALIRQEPDVLVVDDGGVGMAGFIKGDQASTRQIKQETLYHLSRCHTQSVNAYSHLEALYQLAEGVRDLEGDIVECGVSNGGSALALWLGGRKNKKQKRTLWLYDVFDLMPRPSPEDGGKLQAKWEAKGGQWCVGDMGRVVALAKELKIPDGALIFREGDVERTLPQHGQNTIALLHVDATLYRSTKQALEALYPLVGAGGIVTVSTVGHWPGVRLAVEQFWATLPEKPLTLGLDGTTNLYWQK